MGIDFVSTIQESSLFFSGNYNSIERNPKYDKKRDWGIGYYLLHNQRDGFYSLNDFTQSTSEIVDIANQLLKYDPQYNNLRITSDIDNITTRKTNVIDISDRSPWQENPEEQLDNIIQGLRNILDPYLSKLNYNIEITGQSIKKSIQNSEETNVAQIYEIAMLTLDLTLKENQAINLISQFGGIQNSEFYYDRIIENVEEILYEIPKIEKAKNFSPSRQKLILSPDTTYSLLHESIGHGVEADQIINGTSFLSNKMGYKIASSDLTLTDDPHLRGIGWSEYDDEGTKTKGTLIVEDGILIDFLNTRNTAKLMNSPRTGNARCTSYFEKPEPRQTNLFVEPKSNSFDEILEDVNNGILLGPTSLASTSVFTGNLHIEVQYGRMIENGELTHYINPVSLQGNSLDLLNRIDKIGNELIKHPTECLKSRSRINIGAYTPYLSIKEVYLE